MKEWPTSCELTKGNFDIMISALMQGSARSLPCTGVCNGLHFYMCIYLYMTFGWARVCVFESVHSTHTHVHVHTETHAQTHSHTHTLTETETERQRQIKTGRKRNIEFANM